MPLALTWAYNSKYHLTSQNHDPAHPNPPRSNRTAYSLRAPSAARVHNAVDSTWSETPMIEYFDDSWFCADKVSEIRVYFKRAGFNELWTVKTGDHSIAQACVKDHLRSLGEKPDGAILSVVNK